MFSLKILKNPFFFFFALNDKYMHWLDEAGQTLSDLYQLVLTHTVRFNQTSHSTRTSDFSAHAVRISH